MRVQRLPKEERSISIQMIIIRIKNMNYLLYHTIIHYCRCRLQDILSTKRKILRETNAEFKAKVPLLRNEIEKLKQDMKRHEKKAERFAEIQEKTYKELWDFLGKQIAEHVEKVTISNIL